MDKHMPTPDEYAKMVDKASKDSPHLKNLVKAFLIGGLICAIGEGLRMIYMKMGLTTEDAGAMVSVTLIGISALLTGLGVYDKIAKAGGAGSLVPITGFANAMVSPALEFRAEGLILGTAVKLFAIAGPVLVYGTTASFVYGVLLCIFGGV